MTDVYRKLYLVTGGTGFIGSAIVRRLLHAGHRIRVLDNNSRGAERRLAEFTDEIELIEGDIRDPSTVAEAVRGTDGVHHLAFINGTEYFYSVPELVLEVGIKGMINVLDACLKHNVRSLFLASSSEVYQSASKIPTDEQAPLIVPDVTNPRFSYGGAKITSELLAINFGRKYFDRVIIYRPHNIYGPDMGEQHVIPQFALRLKGLCELHPTGVIPFHIQGSGNETRSFCFIDDFVDGVMILGERGEHLGIYHIGTSEEVTMAEVARGVGTCVGRELEIIPSATLPGSTLRRCPDITKITKLGFSPKVSLRDGLCRVARWYTGGLR